MQGKWLGAVIRDRLIKLLQINLQAEKEWVACLTPFSCFPFVTRMLEVISLGMEIFFKPLRSGERIAFVGKTVTRKQNLSSSIEWIYLTLRKMSVLGKFLYNINGCEELGLYVP